MELPKNFKIQKDTPNNRIEGRYYATRDYTQEGIIKHSALSEYLERCEIEEMEETIEMKARERMGEKYRPKHHSARYTVMYKNGGDFENLSIFDMSSQSPVSFYKYKKSSPASVDEIGQNKRNDKKEEKLKTFSRVVDNLPTLAEVVAKEEAQGYQEERREFYFSQKKRFSALELSRLGLTDIHFGEVFVPHLSLVYTSSAYIPVYKDGELLTYQVVDNKDSYRNGSTNRNKNFLAGLPTGEGAYTICVNGGGNTPIKTYYLEGMADSMRLALVLEEMGENAKVVCCFNCGNLEKVASKDKNNPLAFVIADNDSKSRTGEQHAIKAGLPYFLPYEKDLWDLWNKGGNEAVRELLNSSPIIPSQTVETSISNSALSNNEAEEKPIGFITLKELLQRRKHTEHLIRLEDGNGEVRKLFPVREISVITASSGMGKSTLCVHLYMSFVFGLPVFDNENFKVKKQYKCAYIPTEGEDDYSDRVRAWLLDHNIQDEELPSNALSLIDLNLQLDIEGDFRQLDLFFKKEAEKGSPIEVLFIDTLAMSVTDENKNECAKNFLNNVHSLCKKYGTTVILVGHRAKADVKSKDGNLTDYPTRGASVWQDMPRQTLIITKEKGSEIRELEITKANSSPVGSVAKFEFVDKSLGYTVDGKTETIALLNLVELFGDTEKKKQEEKEKELSKGADRQKNFRYNETINKSYIPLWLHFCRDKGKYSNEVSLPEIEQYLTHRAIEEEKKQIELLNSSNDTKLTDEEANKRIKRTKDNASKSFIRNFKEATRGTTRLQDWIEAGLVVRKGDNLIFNVPQYKGKTDANYFNLYPEHKEFIENFSKKEKGQEEETPLLNGEG